jgi:23S rRNA (uracil1939-C5)-methyltransferase
MTTDQPEPVLPHVGDHLTVTIDGMATGGDGIARVQGFTLFIAQAAPGDVLEVEVTEIARRFGRARILAITTPGPDRVAPGCPRAGTCPGCQLQHLSYDAQLEAKRTFVRDGLERIGHLRGVEVLPTIGMADPWHYRNKGEFIAVQREGRVQLGYQDGEDGGFVPLPDCPIHHPLTMEVLRAVEDVATEMALPLAQLITRYSPHQGQALAILVCWEPSDRLPAAALALRERVPALAGVLWSQVRGRSVVRRTLAEGLSGRNVLIQTLGEWEYTVSAESFFQVNNVQGARLLELVRQFAGPLEDKLFADGYCGVGTFLVPLAGDAGRSVGIEEHPVAMKDCADNLARYARHDVHIYEGRIEVIFSRLVRKGRQVDVVVLDPPRKGAGLPVLEPLVELGTRRVVLVSCDPATLGRDAGDLQSLGYRIETVQPLDMFPQTWHVETVALAVREDE